MRTTLVILTFFFCPFLALSEEPPILTWNMESGLTKLHTNRTDIGIYVKGTDINQENYNKLEIKVNDFSEKIKCTIFSFDQQNGLLLKINIGDGPELIGEDRKLSVVNKETGKVIGNVLFAIGCDAPEINKIETIGDLEVGNPSQIQIRFYGKNFNGISSSNIKSIGNEINGVIIKESITNTSFIATLYSYGSAPVNESSYKLKYKECTADNHKLQEKETDPLLTNIRLISASELSIKPEKENFFISEIRNSGHLYVYIPKEGSGLDIMKTYKIIGTDYVDPTSIVMPVTLSDNKMGLDIKLKNLETFQPTRLLIKLKRNDDGKEFCVRVNLLNNPIIDRRYNDDGNLTYIISKRKQQTLVLEGQRLKGVKLRSVNQGIFDIGVATIDENEIAEFPIGLIKDDFPPKKYYFKVMIGETEIETIALDFQLPSIPQEIDKLFVIQKQETLRKNAGKGAREERRKAIKAWRKAKQKAKKNGIDIPDKPGNPEPKVNNLPFGKSDIFVPMGGEDVIFTFDPKLLDKNLGPQSLNVVINYYNPDGTLITSITEPSTGNSNFVIRPDGPVIPISIPVKKNYADHIREWGRAEVVISHSPDFYKQELDRKTSYTQTLHFVNDCRTSVSASLTIPPALFIYGKDQVNRFEILPINVGFGLKLDFRMSEERFYLKRKIGLGLYFAGLNFADRTISSGTQSTGFIKQGDIAFMSLFEINLRRTSDFVKIPLFIGPGFTFPINGLSSRGFLAFGVGINL